MRISLIVAMTRQGVIGRAGKLPWRLSADLKRFKALTMGHHVILGRKTFDSLPGPLPGRKLIVLSRSAAPSDSSRAAFVSTLDAALRLTEGDDEVFVIGGGEIYRQTLARADRLYVTWVEADVAGDTCFPAWDAAGWKIVESSGQAADDRNEHATTLCVYERVAPAPPRLV